MILEALPGWAGPLLLALLAAAALVAVLRSPPLARLAAAAAALLALALLIGLAGPHLAPPENRFARVSPAAGFWMLTLAFALLAADALTRLQLSPSGRLAAAVAATATVALLLASGTWDSLSILKEYAARSDSFRSEAGRHLVLVVGATGAAILLGVPLGILCHRIARLRAGVLGLLNTVQTIPSIALFGLLIAPLAWIATHVPGAAALGIRGIGLTPALVALVGYSLLPVVANTVVGLAGVPAAANDAARGMGMTGGQRLLKVELPLALPVVLAGIRIVLVQNIGLATVAALIGGGGFGTFIFQGIGQTAMDLVLLGALPTVALALLAAVVLDAVADLAGRPA